MSGRGKKVWLVVGGLCLLGGLCVLALDNAAIARRRERTVELEQRAERLRAGAASPVAGGLLVSDVEVRTRDGAAHLVLGDTDRAVLFGDEVVGSIDDEITPATLGVLVLH